MKVTSRLICIFLPTGNPRADTRLALEPLEQCTTAGTSCLARTLGRWATKPNMRKKILKLEFSFWFNHVIHVPFFEWYRKSLVNTLTCLESMLGLGILQFCSPLSMYGQLSIWIIVHDGQSIVHAWTIVHGPLWTIVHEWISINCPCMDQSMYTNRHLEHPPTYRVSQKEGGFVQWC